MTAAPLNLKDVQGDILSGLPKTTETFVFFTIDDNVDAFRTQLSHLIPFVTSTDQVLEDRHAIDRNKKTAASHGRKPERLTLSGFNIAFSQSGLKKMGINDDIRDDAFTVGQLVDSKNLGDKGTTTSTSFVPDWVPAFKNPVHGVMFVSGDCHETVIKTLSQIEQILKVGSHNATIHEVLRIRGDVRPGDQKGHEHFGFLDGISNPAVKNFDTNPNPGQKTVRQGIMLLGRDGDPTPRPPWAVNGSFLVFRYLFQLVPEFDDFLRSNPVPGLTPDEGAEFTGARLVGRWKSGAPLDLAPLRDDPKLGADPKRNNNFNFVLNNDPASLQDQTVCPFAAHIRKTNPRGDLEVHGISTEATSIIRRGIDFGPEVTNLEAREKKTHHGRGLLFVCYQSSIVNGFQFVQKSWANEPQFPPGKPANQVPGADPIIGQPANPDHRKMTGFNPQSQTEVLAFPTEWVIPRGGEYFFSPSISALRDTFAFGVGGHIQGA